MVDRLNEAKTKARIIAIMSAVKNRLKHHNIKLGSGREEIMTEINTPKTPTLVDRIRDRGCKLAGNRFADIYMSRPKRLVVPSIDEFIITFETILEIDARLLTAHEFLELCDLMRFPMSLIHQFARYFPSEDWRTALQLYQLIPANVTEEHAIIGRDELVEQVVTYVWQNRSEGRAWRGHVIISGASGVGKSTVAHAVVRRLLMMHKSRIPLVTIGNTMTSMEQVLYAIGVSLNLKQRNNEPWYLRLKDVEFFHQGMVVLDNVLGNDILPAETILKNLVIMFPATQYIITTQVPGLAKMIPNSYEFSIAGLATSDAQALFWRVYQQADGRGLEYDDVAQTIQQTNGIPMLLIAAANSAASGHIGILNDVYGSVVIGLGAIPELMLQVMSLVSYPISVHFWEINRDLLHIPADKHPQTYLHMLERRQLITRQRSDGYVIHDELRHAVLGALDTAKRQTLLEHIGRQLAARVDLEHSDNDEQFALLTPSDMVAVLQLVQKMEQHQLDDVVVLLCVNWRMQWIRSGMGAELCAVSEACLYRIGDNHPMICELLFTIGSYYGHRGIVESTVRFLTQAMLKAEQRNQRMVLAFAAVECALHGVQQIGVSESERLLWRALTLLVPLNLTSWVARCHDILSHLYMLNGDMVKSLHESDEALRMLGNTDISYGLADAYSNRGLIFMVMGDYMMARQVLSRAEWMFQKLNAPNSLAAVHLRIAAIASLSNVVADARYYLTRAFRQLERTGGINDLLYAIDICSGIMLAEGDGVGTLQLSQAGSMMRENHKLPRGATFDNIVKRHLIHAEMLADGQSVPPLPTNIDELLHVVRRVLKLTSN